MRFSIALLCILFSLTGCSMTPGTGYTPINLKRLGAVIYDHKQIEGGGIIIVGVTTNNPASVTYGIMGVDPNGGPRDSKDNAWSWWASCSDSNCNKDGVTQYNIYSVPAGTYALSWAFTSRPTATFSFVNIGNMSEKLVSANPYSTPSIDKLAISGARIAKTTPTIQVGPGEVVYPGDLVFHSDGYTMMMSIRMDEAKAKDALKDFGDTRPITVRPWTNLSQSAPVAFSSVPLKLQQ